MGFFKKLSNALSGQTHKHYSALSKALDPIKDNLVYVECNELSKDWARTNFVYMFSVLSNLMFPKIHDINVNNHKELFGEFMELERTDQEGLESLAKQLAKFNMIQFLLNSPEGDRIDSLDVSKSEFLELMFEVNGFYESEKQEFDELYETSKSVTGTKLCQIIHETMLNRGFRTTTDRNPAKELAFAQVLTTYHNSLFGKFY